jgi:hypothetical protein
MLETVAGVRPGSSSAEAGEEAAAQAALRAWATRFAAEQGDRLDGAGQVAAMTAMRAEEGNLADVLRWALAAGDRGTALAVLAGLGTFWWIAGEEPRLIALVSAVEDAVADWEPPPELVGVTRRALGLVATNSILTVARRRVRPRGCCGVSGPGEPGEAPIVEVVLARTPSLPGTRSRRLYALCDHPDRRVALLALQYLGHRLENVGDPEGTLDVIARAMALWRESDGPWGRRSCSAGSPRRTPSSGTTRRPRSYAGSRSRCSTCSRPRTTPHRPLGAGRRRRPPWRPRRGRAALRRDHGDRARPAAFGGPP